MLLRSGVVHIIYANADNAYEEPLSGVEYKASVIDRLCTMTWPAGCVIPLAALFRDMSLGQEQLRAVLLKIMR